MQVEEDLLYLESMKHNSRDKVSANWMFHHFELFRWEVLLAYWDEANRVAHMSRQDKGMISARESLKYSALAPNVRFFVSFTMRI